MAETDRQRLEALRGLLIRWGQAAADADVRARAIYSVQIGYISMRISESIEERLTRVPHHVEIYSGKRPAVTGMDRFRDRVPIPD